MMMQMVGAFAEFERAHDSRADDRRPRRRPNRWPAQELDAAKRREIAESVISGRKTGAEMARLYNVSAPTVSRMVAAHRAGRA